MFLNWRRSKPVELPTTSIYFSDAMHREIGSFGSPRHPIWRASPNTFMVSRFPRPSILVIRDLDPAGRHLLAAYPRARLHYLLDDDVWAGIADPFLPASYRLRLRALAAHTADPLLQRAERVYVTSSRLHDRLSRPSIVVQPGLVSSPADLDHHEEGPLSLVFAGTRAHREDLAAISRPLSRFLGQYPECRLETFLGRHAPVALQLPNARHHPPLTWSDYRKLVASRRYHVGLAPALPTPFNAARSCNKMLEFACCGAAPVLGSGIPFRQQAVAAGAAFTSDQFQGDWFALLESLREARSAIRKTAAANRQAAVRLGDCERLRAFWHEELELGVDGLRSAA